MMVPRWLYNDLNAEFHFTMEVLPTMKELLNESWQGKTVFCAIRHSIKQWVQKAYRESKKNCTAVLLLPCKTDQRWFHEYALKGEVRFICGKLSTAKLKIDELPSMLLIFKDHHSHTKKVTSYKKREQQKDLFK